MLRHLVLHFLAHGGIAAVRAVGAAHRALGCDGGEDGRHALHALAEAHVEIPFVIRAKRIHAARDRVRGQRLEARIPVRIHAPVFLEISAEPVREFGPTLFLLHLHRVVQAHEAAAALHLLAELRKVIRRRCGMSPAAVGINHHRVRLREFLCARPFGVQVKFHIHAIRRALPEALREELDSRIMLVLARPVRRSAGDHEDVFFRISGKDGSAQRGAKQDEEREFFHRSFLFGGESTRRRGSSWKL